MRDVTHEDFVERWANFVKENPDKWQNIHAKFLNAQINNNKRFLEKLKSTPDGRRKIIAIYNIKNLDGYTKLLGF